MLVTMRGEWGEFNPWQVPMGRKRRPALELMRRARATASNAPRMPPRPCRRRSSIAFDGDLADGGAAVAAADRRQGVGEMMLRRQRPRLDRRRARCAPCSMAAATCSSSPASARRTYDAAAVGDDDRNFYLWGAMGGAAMVGLGLALAQPERRVAGHHRRRRDADGAGRARHHRRAAAAEPRDRRVRQRPLRRDRHAGEPHR